MKVNLKEKTISFLHDVGLVYSRYSLASMGLSIVESILSNSQACLTGNDLETFNNTPHHLGRNENGLNQIEKI